MRRVLVFLILIAQIVAAGGVQAQSGGGYDLSWSTIDGGGQTWSRGGGYDLGGTIGQPESQSPATGGGYSLQGGFWHRACRPQTIPVTVSCVGTQARLDWTPNAANLAYDIYRASLPYVLPVLGNKRGTVTGAHWTDPDTTTCGDAGVNYFYVVRATCIGAHADAGETAEFDFGLVPGQ